MTSESPTSTGNRPGAGARIAQALSSGVVGVGNAGAVVSGVAFLLLVIATVFSVVMRGVFGRAFMDVVTLGRIAMLVMGFLTAAYALRQGRHVSIDFVIEKVPERLARRLRVIGLLVALVTLTLTAVGSLQYALFSYEVDVRLQSEMDVPAWPFQMVIPVGLAILVAQLVVHIIGEFRSGLGAKDRQ